MTDKNKKIKSDLIWYAILATILLSTVVIMVAKVWEQPAEEAVVAPVENVKKSEIAQLEQEMEDKLIDNLSKMAGVGKVQVSVVLESGMRANYAYNNNTTKKNSIETDKSGGKRETEEITESRQIVMGSSSAHPVVVFEERPRIAGVFVVAQGAKEAKIREDIHNAVKTLLNVAPDRVMVYPMDGM